MPKPTDIRPVAATLYFLPVKTRVPLKFGAGVVTEVTCARVRLVVEDAKGQRAEGWGETPLSVQWVWPSSLAYAEREETLKTFCVVLARAWAQIPERGHPMEVGAAFQERVLPGLLERLNRERAVEAEPMPWLAALVCCSAFDLALHDAYGHLLQRPVYEIYNRELMSRDLADFFTAPCSSRRQEAPHSALRTAPSAPDPSQVTSAAADDEASDTARFRGKFPADFLVSPRPNELPAWHLVGGLDLLDPSELTGAEPNDGYPVLLADWIQRDGLRCLKVKLRGHDAAWDYARLVRVGQMALARDVWWLSADFNCTVTDPAYVNDILDRLRLEHPRIYGMILYVEQPFPYDLEAQRLDVRSVAARKPLFLDESAHDWRLVRLGRALGWSGVALKTCKTQTGALLSLCWAKAHGMTLMVQDLTNPMLAQIPHALLAAHAGTIMGVETNAMQFYPEASRAEAAVHPGLYTRRAGKIDLSTVGGPGFGYQLDRIKRELPPPVITA
jgi:L-alanine-DL-glutamate epimerase-like enolase superfamily enzyme